MPDYIRWLRKRTGPDPIQLNFAAAVIEAESRLLLQRRGDHDAWGFPGGGVELGESVHEAAIREVREETGLAVSADDLLGIYSKYRQVYPNGDVAQPITAFFVCSPIGGELYCDHVETLELRWFGRAELPPLFSRQHQDALKDFMAGRRGVFR